MRKISRGMVEQILDGLVDPKAGERRLVWTVLAAGPRGSVRILVCADGWPILAIRPTGEVVRLAPGPEAPTWAAPPVGHCVHCSRPARPKTLRGLREAIADGLRGVVPQRDAATEAKLRALAGP